ncbi:MAG: TonB-dependent receptor [Gammaproteobacteria bacterium]|nr:TonB-dependent receptor [Gammaproteobacteria bacterium]
MSGVGDGGQRSRGWHAHIQPQTVAFCYALLTVPIAGAPEHEPEEPAFEEVVVVAKREVAFANAESTAAMQRQQSPLTSVLATADNLPGVSIQEGDAFGFDDWSTTISMRGFQISLDEQQLGMTIDGMPNGNSNYGGGAKAGRYVDSTNLAGVAVSQGTADIASRSTEALGGTLDFRTSDPLDTRQVTAALTRASFDGARWSVRFDTGPVFGGALAWLSASRQTATDWVNQSADNERTHVAAKLTATMGMADLTAYLSWDDVHEDNYQRLFSAADYAADPRWDRLTADWTGMPHLDQLYRPGWSTLRENAFSYVKLEGSFGEATLSGGVYYHRNDGRGDWLPPYLVDVVDDGGGPESERLAGRVVNGGAFLGRTYFVDARGVRLLPFPGCRSSITFPYGGSGPEADAACHEPGALAVQSYRHTHYHKGRAGFAVDLDWRADLGPVESRLRGGLWHEGYKRDESRDWHAILDTRIGFAFDPTPYWRQYARRYPAWTTKWYLEESVTVGPLRLGAGIKRLRQRLERNDAQGDVPDAVIDSNSPVLLSAGLVLDTPVPGLELFGGVAENHRAYSDLLLERPRSDLAGLDPESARNVDVGLRFGREGLAVAATWYDTAFRNRVAFVDTEGVAGPNFLIGTDGAFLNAGGVESRGVELSAQLRVAEVELYLAYTRNDSRQLGTGRDRLDAELGVVPGNRVVGVPASMLAVALDWRRGPVRAGISHKVTGARFVDFGNSWRLERYGTADLHVGVDWRFSFGRLAGLQLQGVVNNLFDEEHLGGVAGQGAWIGPPRTASLTVVAEFRGR